MSRALHRLGRFSVRRRRPVVVAWLLAAGLLWLAVAGSGGSYSGDFRIPGAESQRATDLLEERFPQVAGATAQVVVHTPDGDLTAGHEARALGDLVERIGELPHVLVALDPSVTGLVSPDHRTAIVRVQYDGEPRELGEEAYHQLEEAVGPTRDAGLQVELGGVLPSFAVEVETGAAELVGVLGAVVILLVAFGSVVAMGLPIGIALFGLAGGTALIMLMRLVFDMPAESGTLATMIGLGVGIDYAL